MDAVTMVVTCCPFAAFSSCVPIRKRSMLCGRSWSVFVRVFTPMSNTLSLVVVFVVLLLAQALRPVRPRQHSVHLMRNNAVPILT